jgi:methyl-accepting chemotaxis protein
MKLKLKGKLFCLVGMAIFLALAIVGIGLFYYSQIETSNALKEDVNKIDQKVAEARVTEKIYLQFFTAEAKKQFEVLVKEIDTELTGLKGKTSEESWLNQINTINDQFQQYRGLFGNYVTTHSEHDNLKKEMTKPLQTADGLLNAIIQNLDSKQQVMQMDGNDIGKDEYQLFNVARECKIIFLQLQSLQQQYQDSGNEKFLHDFQKLASGPAKNNNTALMAVSSSLKNNEFIKSAKEVEESLNKFLKFLKESQILFEKEAKLTRALNDTGKKVLDTSETLLNQAEQFIKAKRNSAVTIITIILVAGLGIALFLGFYLSASITRPINRIIQALDNGAGQVAAASTEVASSSQSLAAGSSQQAASLEETTASVEELSSMTNQNSDNATQANSLTQDTTNTVEQANKSMTGLTTAMKEISAASDETAKIIKNIDEIAFQTNLLALNAAVEAARAGEAGAGFAVVADEVRNLAMRAAEAAQNTANLIETTVIKVKEGSMLVDKTAEAFAKVSTSTNKVNELVREIAAASQEQAQGVSQINKALAEMDRIVQQNAANAEESASASEELSAQAQQMKGAVGELVDLVGRDKDNSLGGHSLINWLRHPLKQNGKGKLIAPQNTKLLLPTPKTNQLPTHHIKSKGASPDQVIPFGDNHTEF